MPMGVLIFKLLYHFDRSFTSRITRPHELNQFGFRHASQGPVNILKIGIVGIKKIWALCANFMNNLVKKIVQSRITTGREHQCQ
jgi:hypothetical protein